MNKEKMNEQQKSNIVYRIICAWCGKDLGPSYVRARIVTAFARTALRN